MGQIVGQVKLICFITNIVFGLYLINMKYAWIIFPAGFKKTADPWILVISGFLLFAAAIFTYVWLPKAQKHLAKEID